jgi:hypothetical protein
LLGFIGEIVHANIQRPFNSMSGITRFAFSSRIKTDETGTTPLAALVAGEI